MMIANMSSNIKTPESIINSLLSAFEICKERDESNLSTCFSFFFFFAGYFPYLLLDNEIIKVLKALFS